MGRLFGTDGVRGLANADLTPALALAVAASAVGVLATRSDRRPTAVVGRDPRASGEMLEAAVVAGLTSAGADVIRVGVLPTPAVAYLTDAFDADVGVMLSASHNPMPDNGVKLFAPGGDKLPDEVEDEIEDGLDAAAERPIGAAIGRVRDRADGGELYADHLLASLRHRLDGLRVVVDCAHGAASRIAPAVYRRAGARVTAINAEPDGLNINDGCGSTHLDPVRAAVREFGADVGIAHDGDADRCLAVTAGGELVDGDALLAICALAMRESRTLAADTIVVTVMSNLGLHQAMTRHGISVLTTPVGDRYVLEALRRHRLSLGGEQSGHLIFPALAGTGDGILTALALLSRVAELGVPLAAAASVLHRLPQVLVNVPVRDRTKVAADDRLGAAVAAESGSLGESGRVLLRPSGTEQLVRVMVEAPTHDQAQAIADRLATAVAAV